MMGHMTGHCLCGDVAFILTGAPVQIVHCHCESCRRSTSSPVTTFVIMRRNEVRFTQGRPRVFASSPGVRRSFCGRCGSPLAYECDQRPDHIDLYLCSFADPRALIPEAHVHVEEQVAWFEVLDDLPRYGRTPRDGAPIRHGPRPDDQRGG
jgi:hypothetical protein